MPKSMRQGGLPTAGMPSRRSPPPWSVDEQEACFIVRDATGQALANVYFEEGRDVSKPPDRLRAAPRAPSSTHYRFCPPRSGFH
jgi:hypothetical protein